MIVTSTIALALKQCNNVRKKETTRRGHGSGPPATIAAGAPNQGENPIRRAVAASRRVHDDTTHAIGFFSSGLGCLCFHWSSSTPVSSLSIGYFRRMEASPSPVTDAKYHQQQNILRHTLLSVLYYYYISLLIIHWVKFNHAVLTSTSMSGRRSNCFRNGIQMVTRVLNQ